jgi:hypothetical protein
MNMPMPEARALTETALLDIYNALESAANPEEFFSSVDAIITKSANQLPLPVSLGTPDPLKVEGTRAVDVDNAPLVHQYLGEMDRANASDARLWSYLALATYRTYMEKRWPLVVSSADADAWKRRVRDRWILHTGSVTRGRLVRHGIARLWWVCHLTIELNASEGIAKNDVYGYSREVFKSEDRLNAIFDREVGAYHTVMRVVLDHAAKLEKKATDKYLHKIMQYLTLVHGYRDIGILRFPEICNLVNKAAARNSE